MTVLHGSTSKNTSASVNRFVSIKNKNKFFSWNILENDFTRTYLYVRQLNVWYGIFLDTLICPWKPKALGVSFSSDPTSHSHSYFVLYMYIYIYVCVCVCVYLCACTYIYVFVSMCIFGFKGHFILCFFPTFLYTASMT